MNEPARHLSVAHDPSSGEVCPGCQELQKQLDGAERDIRSWRARCSNLEADNDKGAKHHELFPQAKRCFDHWRIVCNHKRSAFTTDRFRLIEPFLENKEKYGVEIVMRAIDGAAFQSWVSKRTNGSLKLHNEWKSIFASADTMEERANRAPRGWTMAVSEEMEGWQLSELRPKDWAGLRPPAGWEPPPPETDGVMELIVENDEGGSNV